jgi:hypothetical protein
MGKAKWVMLAKVSPYDAPQYAVPPVTVGGKPPCPFCFVAPDEQAHLCAEKVDALDAEMEAL